MAKEENLHSGHRKRMREEFLAKGFDESTPIHKVLEMLLFHCIPRKDTNELAHQLIKKYKNLSGVLDAPLEELAQFEGLSQSNAILFKLIIPVARMYEMEKRSKVKFFKSYAEAGEYLVDMFFGINVEKVAIVGLDGHGQKVLSEFVSEGDIASVGVPMRGVIKRIIETEATAVIIAHNHPRGTALPSDEDISVTAEIAGVFKRIGVTFVDHMIIASDDYVSLSQSGKYSYLFK